MKNILRIADSGLNMKGILITCSYGKSVRGDKHSNTLLRIKP
jgi:hypothetical protein